MITLDFSKAPGTPGSPFRQVFQSMGNCGHHLWVVQQFGCCWGFLVRDTRDGHTLSGWNVNWDATQALAELNRVLETL
jgi:hypothetical protein